MFWERAEANRRKTRWLFASLFGLVLLVGWAAKILLGSWWAPVVVGLAGGLLSLVAARFSEWLTLFVLKTREATRDEQQVLINTVEEMAIAAQLPVPKCVVVDDPAPNAFAVGSGKKAVIGVTTGLLPLLDRNELQGVIAHEMAHIGNEDTRVMTTAFVMTAAITYAADALYAGRLFGLSKRRNQEEVWKKAVAVGIAVLAPLAARLITMAVSREREYLADAEAVRLTRNPAGLAGALRKLAEAPPAARTHAATAHLFFHSHFQDEKLAKLFSTHPPLAERISRIEAM